ncbi:MAG TPA: phosphotransferase [Syntrophorhabdaceae bacterium]|jgi:hypothetical protein
MLLEMHCHSSEFSTCSHVKALDLIAMMVRKGLQGLVITDHHHLWKDEDLKDLARAAGVPGYFVVLSGQEVSTADFGDVLVYGADETISKGTRLPEIRSRYPRAALVFAHPYRNGRAPNDQELTNPAFNGIEIFSSNHSVAENARGLRDWHRLKFTALAGTDTHAGSYAGLYPTLFDHPVVTAEELAREIVSGRCRPLVKEIPKEGANTQVEEITIGTKGEDESRERIIIKRLRDTSKWLRAERSFYIVEELSRHGFNEGPYRIAKFIDGDHEDKVLIEQGLKGNSLFEKLVQSDTEERRDFLRLSAQWLAKLHNLKLRITAPGEFLEVESRRLARYVDGFATEHHTYTRRIAEITEAVGKWEKTLYADKEEYLVQGHGDYHPKNIYIGQDKKGRRETLYAAAIDFDSSYCLPPAFDVGDFVAQYRNQFQDYPEIRASAPEELFLDAYLATADERPPDFLLQVELFRARAGLSIAYYLVKLGLGDSENLWRLLVETEQTLVQSGFMV